MAQLEVSVEDGVATLTMNRPEARNALGMEMRPLLKDAFHELEADPGVRCLVLQGAGGHFMAGGDVTTMGGVLDRPPAEIRAYYLQRIHDLHLIVFAMRRMAKPIVASVQGAAAGAGVSFALACDLVIAAENAFFTLAYCHLGTTPDASSTFTLPRAVGIKKAMEMVLLGDRVDAATAAQMGMVNFVVPTADLAAETQRLARRLAAGPTHAYGNAKRLLYHSLEKEWEAQLQAEAEAFADCASRADFKEGVTAFLEKRKAQFTGQ